MLLLEMVSGRRNVDPAIENRNEVYFPEWMYERLVHGEDLGLASEKQNDEDIMKKLVIVALWLYNGVQLIVRLCQESFSF